jgi:coenzyme F420-0:L-glutamate ligase/coenzyme F420-1:gamma-L-glutamate ligase
MTDPLPRRLSFQEVIRGRRSVRVYRPDPVPRELIEQTIEAARWAPSPHGRMPWRFAVLTNPEPKARLADSMGEEWIRQLSLDGDPPEIVAKRLARSHERVKTAPVCIIICLYLEDLDVYPDAERRAAETTMAVQSLGAAAQNLLLAAYDLGLDAGWLCAPLFCPDAVRRALDLAPTLLPHALLTLGYAAQEPKRRERIPLEELVVRFD